MQVVVFGATGMVGKQLVQQALFKGYHVKAFGRNVYTTDYLQTENLQLVQGALFDASEVYGAVKGCDAVLSALGGGADGTDKTRTLGLKNIVAQMEKAGVKRIIGIGTIGILNADESSLLMEQEDYPQELIPVSIEHQKAFELLKGSDLDWTFVCPPAIKEGSPTGDFITTADYVPDPNNDSIIAGDLALFMLGELEKNEYVKHRVGISN